MPAAPGSRSSAAAQWQVVGWTWTGDPSTFVAAVGSVLDADPVHHTFAVSKVHLRPRQARFGVWTGPGGPGGAIHSPPFPVLPVVVPDPAAAPLVNAWPAGADAVVGDPALAAQIAAAWCSATGGQAVLSHAERLHRLESLHQPVPCDEMGRLMTETDVELAAPHLVAFSAEAGSRCRTDRSSCCGCSVVVWSCCGLSTVNSLPLRHVPRCGRSGSGRSGPRRSTAAAGTARRPQPRQPGGRSSGRRGAGLHRPCQPDFQRALLPARLRRRL
jgi:hypothetical protein